MTPSEPLRGRLPRPTYANIAATLALAVACGGTAVAVAPVLGDRSVSSRMVQPGAIRAEHLAPGAVRDRNVRPGQIGAAKIQGLVTRRRGPLPVGVAARAGIQAAGGPSLAIVTVVGPSAAPQAFPGYPPHPVNSLGGNAIGIVSTSATAQVSCPDGSVVNGTGIAVSQATGPVAGTFVRAEPPTGSYPGTWTFHVSPDSTGVDQGTQSVTASADFVATFQSPPAPSAVGQWPGGGRIFFQGVASPASSAPAINPPAVPPGAGVQAIAYCLEIVPGA